MDGTKAKASLALQQLEAREVPSATIADPLVNQARGRYAVATDAGPVAQVNVYDAPTGAMIGILTPFGRDFRGGARVATGDVTGDGVQDIVVAPGVGGGPLVKVFDGKTLQPVSTIRAFGESFQGGASVAVGDVTGDGRADVVIGSGPNSQARVEVYSGATLPIASPGRMQPAVLPTPWRSTVAYDPAFRGGVSVAVGDYNGDGRADVITGAGFGNTPLVKVFSGVTGNTISAFYAADIRFRGGVEVAAGDLNGDGKAEIVTGLGLGGGSNIRVFSQGKPTVTYQALPTDVRGVRVAVRDVNGDGQAEIVAASAQQSAPRVRIFQADGTSTGRTVRTFPAMMPTHRGGLFAG
jgi:hypothetical protein